MITSSYRYAALALGLPLLLATACTRPAPTPNGDATEPTMGSTPETPETPTETTTTEPTPTDDDLVLVLANDGIQVVEADTGVTRTFPFGSDMAPLQATVINLMGTPASSDYNEECPGGPLTVTVWRGGLVLNADGDSFAGWSVRPEAGSDTLTTMSGIGIGSTLHDLEDAYEVDTFDSSLGVEFFAGQLAGLLSDSAPNAVITNLWAGEVCMFR